MTIFEEYLNSKKEENKLEMDYLWNFYDYQNSVTDIVQVKNNLQKCQDSWNQYDEVREKKVEIEERICELSFLTDEDAKRILPKLMKDMTFEDYEFESLVIDNVRRIFLIRRGVSLRKTITMDDLLTNENVIFLASTLYPKGFNLYQVIPNTNELGSELNANLYNSQCIFLKDFIDGYICAKAEREEITLEDYYFLVRDSIEHGYDEELLEYYDLEDAYKEHDRKANRRVRRIKDARHNKGKRAAINRVKAQREIANLPSKYEPTSKNGTLTFVKELETTLGRKFSSLEKEIINSWLIVGFSEELVIAAYREAQARATYNIKSIAEILRDLSSNKVEQKDVEVKLKKNL